jgi:hypothetical protein
VASIKDPLSIDEEDARTFLAKMYDKKANTAYKTHYALVAFFKSQHIPFDIPAPKIDLHPFRPTHTPEEMQRLIICTKEAGDLNEKGALAISSTYATRKIEMKRMDRPDLNLMDRTLIVRAAKGGRERTHLIPDVVLVHIANFDFTPRTEAAWRNLYWGMVRRAGLELTKGYGWHAIRRAFYTGLAGKVEFIYRHEFMRWPMRGLNLDAIYDQTTPAQIDELVFKAHPFLPFWADA